jgi:hypothetical protein
VGNLLLVEPINDVQIIARRFLEQAGAGDLCSLWDSIQPAHSERLRDARYFVSAV